MATIAAWCFSTQAFHAAIPCSPWRAAQPQAAHSRPPFSHWSCCQESGEKRIVGAHGLSSLAVNGSAIDVRLNGSCCSSSLVRISLLQLVEALGCLSTSSENRSSPVLGGFHDLVFGGRALLGPSNRLLARLHVDHPVAAKHFLGLGEGPSVTTGLPVQRNPRAIDGGCSPSSASTRRRP